MNFKILAMNFLYKQIWSALLLCVVSGTWVSCGIDTKTTNRQNLTQYVDPFIGSGEHGHVFVGANVPFGFVQLGPTQHSKGWDWCSGYHYSDSTIIGFGHQHLSGTGIGDLGDISFMPAIGNIITTRGELPDESTGIFSYFSHNNEIAKPGYYSVILDRFGIRAELTASKRVGFHKYTFPASSESKIIIDLEHGIGWDSPVEGYLVMENDSVVSGYRKSKGWAKDQTVYFTAVFSKPMKGFLVNDGIESKEGSTIRAQKAFGQVLFETEAEEVIFAKVALSPVSINNAKLNMLAEIPDWNFNQIVIDADKLWNDQLGKILIETNDIKIKRTFYTALYHTMIAPSVFCDVNGDYRGSDANLYNDPSYVNYTTFSLWDTYRAAHPLMTIIHPEMVEDIAKTMINIFEQQGKLPVWHLMGNETDCMVGNPGIPVLVDLVLKNFKVDKVKAYEAIKSSSMLNERGMNWLKEYGYIPYDKEPSHETVAKTMEYALADWCVAQVAFKLGKDDDYRYFSQRSKAYQYFFDENSRFMRGLSSSGQFREPFDPFHSAHMEDDYCEGNAWQYTWLVPHDIPGLVELFGSESKFIEKLDSLFIVEGVMGEKASADITGLIGQYAHGNEPSHHVAYIYPFVGQQWKTAEKVREILTTLYDDTPSGLCGNEDVGQMSAWYVMSSMGFYQVAPAGGIYIFGSPLLGRAIVNVGKGRSLEIIARNNSPENIYIQSVRLNGQPYTKSFIKHADVVAGGVLEFEMGNETSFFFGSDKNDRP